MDFEKLPPFAEEGALNVVTETPRGSRNKYSYDAKSGLFLLKKTLPVGMSFPFDFGFVPGTKGEDGDPIDALVLMDEPAPPGCLVRCQALGVIEAEQTEEGKTGRNDRLIVRALPSTRRQSSKELSDLGSELLREIEAFFINYNALAGKKFKVLKRSGPKRAEALVRRAATKS